MAFDPLFPPHFTDQMTSITWPLVALNLGILNLKFRLTFSFKLADLGVFIFMYSALGFQL